MPILGDYIEQIRGVSYKPEDICASTDSDAVAILRANNIQDDDLIFDDLVYVKKDKVSIKQYIQKGDIVVCASSGSKNLVGKAAIATENLSMAFGAFCKVVRPKKLMPRYIGYFFQSPKYRSTISELSGGANINNIRNEHIDELDIAIVSEEEQERIINELDALSNLITLRKQQLAKLDELVKARFVELFGDPVTNEKDWPRLTLGDICEIGSSKRVFEKDYVPSGIPFFRTKEIVELSKGNPISTELFITEEHFAELKKSYGAPKKDDLLISAVGTIGTIWIVSGDFEFYFKDGNLIQIKSSPTFNSIFMKYLLDELIANYKKEMSTGTAYSALTIAGLKKMLVYDVPLEFQKKFAAFVEQTDKSKLAIQKSLEKLETLKKALMQKYFG